jgi:putative ABC transport system ATP-binding protein
LIIQIKDLGKTYKNGLIEVEALKNVDLEIDKGEFVSIMGPSGSGKSTLMNLIGCLDRATSGIYILDNEDISKRDDTELASIRNKRIGFVFQSFNLLPRITAAQNIELPMIYAGISKKERLKRVEEALERVDLSDRGHHKPNELSGGQKQRVAIARALVNNPSIILADEPTGNLDSVSGEEIISLFQDLNNEGATILLVTHEKDIAQHTKRIVSFRDGRLVNDIFLKEVLNAKEILREMKKDKH